MNKSITEAIQAQRTFFGNQGTREIHNRLELLKRLQKEIVKNEDRICEMLYADFKKPPFETLVAETQFVLAELKDVLKNLKYWSKPERVSGSWLNFPSSDWIYKEPYGTVLVMAPWNYPFQLAMLPLIGAIAAGNTVVLKPSELTPHTSALLNEILSSVFTKEQVLVVEGGVEKSQQLLKEEWDYIFFTGSTRVGKLVYESAAAHLTPVTLELGGKSPCIVDETAAIGVAAKRIVWGKFLNAGQTCIAPDYILVQEQVKDALIEALKKNIESFYGDTRNPSKDLARIVSTSHYERLIRLLEGQEIVFGGHTQEEEQYLSPTLLLQSDPNSPVMQEEIFGPILPVIVYKEEDEIAPWLLSQGKPLAAYVFSKRKSFQERFIKKYRFGGGVVNDTLIHITNKNLPFGGVGHSGIGAYHGKRTFDLFSHQKSIVKRGTWIDIPLRNPPYTLPLKFMKKMKHLL